ncbi:AraC family transcriptional regulator [Streptomyces mobaraensis NBRC 13819 = DSM 40847]|uniref:AraC family transcriptional regulator n=1 Tax=Streptomyces mobaraensis (strain ATCC 29032 / DSM 40847 / JCM 4168 / NBRC 13819 / NCIMB 11159 / IPCR 16-22) TaxID=1223523 RepID=M3C8M1_STRM1|nr:AraC family transcriptional regulator [Streptomyces mobaraensis]EMF00342.1 AraC family transcriptional regulator [Streptomyces mobaraensis NBRC 13819 = DSM 40847]QTT74457.1 AraC family transcriptional regulator [Streptomyces mobaraensis NBRC 13819 = DSM 40847]
MPEPALLTPRFTTGEPTIGAHFVRAALAGAVRLGHDPVPLLQTARIPPLLPGDDRARVTPEQFTALVRAVRRTTRDEFLGLGTAPSRPGTFAMMCHACVGCPDLGTAVDRAVRFYGLFPGGPALALEHGAEEAVFAVRNDLRRLPEGRFLAECALVVWHRLASWLIRRRIALRWAEFAYPAPPYAAEYGRMFGCPVRFGAHRTGVGLARHWLSAPLLRDEAGLTDLLRRAPADLLRRRDYGTTVTEQVRGALAAALREDHRPARLPEATETAARLAVSPATLRRRLAAEGTSYRRVKDQVRRDAALSSLAAGREPTTELAARLGFSETTAFHRAFRRWTGTTPGTYRRQSPAPAPTSTSPSGV